ncbi:MAG: AlpA family phage regulatory protein [Desulfobacteraceae bacterium]|nr:AlpA family phage regulatory protein [Desulfobacteraceae bacterium]
MQNIYVSDKQLGIRYNAHRTSIWRWVRHGKFPAPIKIGPGCTRWDLRGIEKWETQIKEKGQSCF